MDYLTFRQRLAQIDARLRASGAERDFVQRALNQRTSAPAPAPKMTAVAQGKFQQRSRRALRCTLLRTLLQEDYRGFSCQLAGNPLYQWFCQVDAVDRVQVPSKSEVQRFAHRLLQALLQAFGSRGPLVFGLDETLERRWGRRIAARGVYRDAPLQQGGHQ